MVEEEKADLLWVYILGCFVGIVLISILLVVCCRVKKEKEVADEAQKDRDEGIHKTWGVKTDVLVVDDDGQTKSIHDDRTIDGETRNESTMNVHGDTSVLKGKEIADAEAAPVDKGGRR